MYNLPFANFSFSSIMLYYDYYYDIHLLIAIACLFPFPLFSLLRNRVYYEKCNHNFFSFAFFCRLVRTFGLFMSLWEFSTDVCNFSFQIYCIEGEIKNHSWYFMQMLFSRWKTSKSAGCFRISLCMDLRILAFV